jgi:hypothetical protein
MFMFPVIPAKAGIHRLVGGVDPRLRGGDDIRSSEKSLHSLNARGQRVDLLLGVVKSQRSAHRGGHAEAVHDRLSAMVAGPNRDTLAVQNSPHVVGMHAFQNE